MPFCPRCGDEFESWVTACPDCGLALTNQKAKVLKIKSAPLKLVTVAVFDYSEEALLTKAKLESQGIRVYVLDGQMMSANWLLNTALGGIKLQVDESQAEKAVQIVEATKKLRKTPKDYSGPLCPVCHSSDVRYELFSPRLVFLTMLISPLPFITNNWRCNNCDHTWKAKKE
jgi:hypothetical protein